jgi:adenylate cyclase
MASPEDPAFSLGTGMVRKLAAILSADAAGYSRLMGEDEAATLQTLTAFRAVIAAFVQQHRGRVVDTPGDNLLAEFASVLDAMQCAVAIQRELHIKNASLPLQRRMNFRVGINLGDVIVDGERIYGDGVNIAARLESMAEAGGICISGSVYEQIKTKVALGYEDIGLQAVKNIAEPVHVYRVRTEAGVAVSSSIRQKLGALISKRRSTVAAAALLTLLVAAVSVWQLVFRSSSTLPDKPSIAVLPFVNMSGDPAQEYFSDGMTEDLITELSRLRGLFVVARNSVFTYKGKVVRPEQVGRELGVRYLIEGSVRKANDRIRITAQLVDATTGYHVWAQYYDRELKDIFGVQEDIARRITKALAVRLTKEEERHMGRPYTNSEVAWELFMRGLDLFRRSTPKDNADARKLFESAIGLDPQFARAYAMLAATHRQDWTLAWTSDRETSEDLGYRFAQKAVELARNEMDPKPSLPFALQQWGFVLLYRGRHQEALDAAREAVRLNPAQPEGHALEGQVLTYRGQPEEGLAKTQQAIDLNPKYPVFYDFHRGQAYYVLGFLTKATDQSAATQYFQQAETHLRKALEKAKGFRSARTYLVAVLGELGQDDEAVKETAILRDMGRPQASLIGAASFQEYARQTHPFENPAITARLIELWQAAESRLSSSAGRPSQPPTSRPSQPPR